jgi:hypothetical protein
MLGGHTLLDVLQSMKLCLEVLVYGHDSDSWIVRSLKLTQFSTRVPHGSVLNMGETGFSDFVGATPKNGIVRSSYLSELIPVSVKGSLKRRLSLGA